jgi:hypothetical protein
VAAVRTPRNKALQPADFGDLGRPVGRATRRGRGSVQDMLYNPPARRKDRSAKPEHTAAAAQRPPRLAAGRRKQARLAGAQLVRCYTVEQPLVRARQ